jgi:hypothetical protein
MATTLLVQQLQKEVVSGTSGDKATSSRGSENTGTQYIHTGAVRQQNNTVVAPLLLNYVALDMFTK